MSTPAADVIPVREGDDLDWTRLESWLLSNIAGLDGPTTVAQFGGGHANLTCCVTFDERDLVVRRPPHGDIAPGAHDMEREHRVLAGLAPAFDRAPQSLAFCRDATVIGAPFVVVVVERCIGLVVRDRLPAADRMASLIGNCLDGPDGGKPLSVSPTNSTRPTGSYVVTTRNPQTLHCPQRLQTRQLHVRGRSARPGLDDSRLGHGHARRPAHRT